MSDTLSTAIEFIRTLEGKKHIMLYYEDDEYAKLVEFLFLKQGLDLGEDCIHATDEDSGSVVLNLLRYGISLEDFLSKKIQVFYIPPVTGTTNEILTHGKIMANRIFSNVKPPVRIVSRIISDISMEQGMLAELEMEKITHNCFEDFGGMLMCPYKISSMEKRKKFEWVKDLYSNHHAVIYIPKLGEGGVICSC